MNAGPRIVHTIALTVLSFSMWLPNSLFASSESYVRYVKGLSEERAGHMKEALAEFEKVVQEDPQAVAVYRDLASLQLRMGEIDAALVSAQKVRDLAPKEAASYVFLGNVLLSKGDVAKAGDAYQDALKIDPNNLPALQNLGNYYTMSDPRKSLPYFERYLKLDPGDSEIYFQKAMAQQKIGDLSAAIATLKQCLQFSPNQTAPHLGLAEIYELRFSTAAAIEQYTQVTQLQPHDPMAFMHLGRLYYLDHQFDQSLSQFQNARALVPEEPSVYYWLARVSEELKAWPEAAQYAEKSYELTHNHQFIALAAYYLTLAQKVDDATVWLEKARKTDPDNSNILLFLGIDYLELNKPMKALDILKYAVDKHPQDAALRFQLGLAEDHLGHFDAAVQEFQADLAINPKDAGAMNYLGYSYVERGVRLPEAEAMLRKAVEIEPNNGAYLDSLGWARFKQNDPKEAAQWLEKAATLTPDALIFDHLGDVYKSAGQLDRAVDVWKKSLDLDSKNNKVRQKIRDANAHVMPGTDQRKFLKYVEGNFRQIQDLRAAVEIKARWKHHPFQITGSFFYKRPDRAVLQFDVPAGQEAPRLRIAGGQVYVDPPAYAESLQSLPSVPLVLLPTYFSAEILTPFDHFDVAISSDNAGKLHYTCTTGEEAWIDDQLGFLTRYTKPNSAGGRDDFQFSDYHDVEGLWLPSQMQLTNRKQHWEAHLSLTNWVVNHAPDAAIFNPP